MTGEHRWTAFLLPGGAKPENLGASYIQIKQQCLMTTPIVGFIAYLMHCIRQGLPLVDTNIYTWAEGEFTDAKGAARAPSVLWDADFGWVFVSCGYIGDLYYSGVRSPIE